MSIRKTRAQTVVRHGIATSLTALVAICAPIYAASAVQTKSYVISWLTLATYSQEGDCSTGLEPNIDTMYRRILAQEGRSPTEVDDLMKEFGAGVLGPKLSQAIVFRGRVDGKPVNIYQNPESLPDPKMHVVDGRYGLGFNLDGKGAASPNGFEDPETHEKGINNQYFRAMGCLSQHRAMPPDRPIYFGYTWGQDREFAPAWLISLTGDDPGKDGPVTVTFNRAIEAATVDATSEVRANMTFRIDVDPRKTATFHGAIKDGVLTVEPADFRVAGESPFGTLTEFNMTNAHLRLKIKPNGNLDGLLGGYQLWQTIYYYYASTAPLHESMVGVNMHGVYYALKNLADADPDPKTGQNMRISATYRVEAVPAFAVQPTTIGKSR